jgi:hypothetical protein
VPDYNTNITPPRVQLTDPRTGLISREWYLFFLSLFNKTGNSNVSLDDLQLAPPQTVSLPSDASALATQFTPEPSELVKRVEALEVAPALQPFTKRSAFGSFYDTTTQTAAAINTAYAMTFNTTDLSFGVTVGTPTSRIYVDTQGVYNIQFSAQLDKTTAPVGLVYIWLRVNGTNVANSATQIRIQGNNAETVAAWNFLANLKAGDYFELMWSVDDNNIQIVASGAVAPVPAIPSVILTVSDNISA